ncbi:hypothetical protein [Ralstonia mannitolilytica]|nr:hypothetical protein [Ralstonia mannitolilytica]
MLKLTAWAFFTCTYEIKSLLSNQTDQKEKASKQEVLAFFGADTTN